VLPILQPQLRPLRARQKLTMRHFLRRSLRIVVPRPIFQVRASGELAWRSTRKGVVRGAASGRDSKAFSMSAGEGSEADRSEGRSKGRRKKRGGRGLDAGLGSDRPGWPGRASTLTSESDHRRGKFGSTKGRIRAASLLGGRIARGDHVRPTSRGLNSGGWAARPVRGEGRER
jgi:hypothetical protein